MKLLSGFVSLAILSAPIVSSIPITRRDVDEALVPQFGFSAGVNPTGTGDCDGAVNGADGQPIKIPCSCPPDRAAFIQSLNANVAAGNVVNNPSVPISFPEDDSVASQLARINAATVTLQNLNGPGQGCPVASTTFQAQAAAVDTPGPQVVEAILKRQSPTPAVSVIGPLGGILARQLPTPAVSVIGPIGAILMARDSESVSATAPTVSVIQARTIIEVIPSNSESVTATAPTVSVTQAATASVIQARTIIEVIPTDSELVTATAPTTSVIQVIPSDSESVSVPAPTTSVIQVIPSDSESVSVPAPTIIQVISSDSESASALAPIPTTSFRLPPVIEDIL